MKLGPVRPPFEEEKKMIVAGAGTGLSAKCAEAGGADLIIVCDCRRSGSASQRSLAALPLWRLRRSDRDEIGNKVLPSSSRSPCLRASTEQSFGIRSSRRSSMPDSPGTPVFPPQFQASSMNISAPTFEEPASGTGSRSTW